MDLHVLLLITILATGTSISIQPKRWINNRPSLQPRSLHRRLWWWETSTLLEGTLHTSTSTCVTNNQHYYARTSIREPRSDNRITTMHKHHCKDETATTSNSLLRSLAFFAFCRRLSFLVLSVILVNFVRTSILKIPKSDKKMFDECPWPFTLFHDPIKFVKDGATQTVVVWVALCQTFRWYEKTRGAIVP